MLFWPGSDCTSCVGLSRLLRATWTTRARWRSVGARIASPAPRLGASGGLCGDVGIHPQASVR
eukprot:6710930-Pyramimonas_sp.AAC.1